MNWPAFGIELGDWLREADVPDTLIDDIVLVINEACTNCVEHAYRGHNVGTMLLEVTIDDEIRGAHHRFRFLEDAQSQPRQQRARVWC